MTVFNDRMAVSIEGHVRITSTDPNGENEIVHLDRRNAVHSENMSIIIARAISDQPNGTIYSMYFGTGGATVDPLGNIVYADPNVTGAADLNTPVYFEVVDQNKGAPSGNQMSVRHINGTLFSDIEIRCVLDKNEPVGQQAFDNTTTSISSTFTFNEIGLKNQEGLLLTHITFNPIEKSANRVFTVIYLLRIRVD